MHYFEFVYNLRFKILALFSIIMIIPLTLLMGISLSRTTTAAKEDFNKRLSYASRLFRESLEDQLDSLKIRVKTVADFDLYHQALSGFNASETIPIMQYEMARSGLDYIAIIKNGHHNLYSQGSIPHTRYDSIVAAMCHSALNVNMYVISDEPWIFAAAKITKLRDADDYHVVFAQKLPKDFADKLKSLTGAEFSLLYGGKWITTTLIDNYGRRRVGNFPDDPDVKQGKIEVLGRWHFFVREEALVGKISESIFLEISLPDSEYNILGRTLRRDFTLFGILGLLLAMATGTVLALHIAKPINQLAEKTSKVATGDMHFSNSYERKDEIGLLYNNFAHMITKLREEKDLKEKKIKELNTLFAISNAVNLLADSDELLKEILEHSIEIMEAERGSIMLLDDHTDELVVKVASGGRYRIVSGTPVKLGQGICGAVARDGVGKICNQGFKDPEFKNFGSLLPVGDIQSLICSPLRFKEGTIGVVNIVNKRNNRVFNENDLSLLNLIASQAAVTIENNKLYELSITDGLTRLFVHRYFQARLSEELLRARRYGLTLSLIMIDIDNFKSFNDTYGHQIGDLVIQRVAQCIKDTVRTHVDVPCRYGGEEMAIILPETRPDEAFHTAERLRENIAGLVVSAPAHGELRITVSVGVASYPNHCHDKVSLITAADKALYTSKSNGKNRSTMSGEI